MAPRRKHDDRDRDPAREADAGWRCNDCGAPLDDDGDCVECETDRHEKRARRKFL